MLILPCNNTSVAQRQAEDYYRALYGSCVDDDGHIILVDSCRYRPLMGYRPSEICEAARAVVLNPGCYVKVNLMDCRAMLRRKLDREKQEGRPCQVVGSATEVKTIVSFHLDVDAGKAPQYPSRAEALEALDQMPRRPSLIVNSNGPNFGFHAYWIFAQPYRLVDEADREHLKILAKRWQNHLAVLLDRTVRSKTVALDATANLDRLLRPAGSLRKSGNLVEIFRHDGTARYSIADLSLPPSTEEKEAAIERGVNRALGRFSAALSMDRPVQRYPVQQYVEGSGLTVADLLIEAGYVCLGQGSWLRPGSTSGSRTLVETVHRNNGRPGVCVFSSADPMLSCQGRTSEVGAFRSIDAVFVAVRFSGDWSAAAAWCRSELQSFAALPAPTGSLARLGEVTP